MIGELSDNLLYRIRVFFCYLVADGQLTLQVDRLTELVLQEQVLCRCVYHREGRPGVLAFSRECSGFGHWGWRIIYVKFNSEAFLF